MYVYRVTWSETRPRRLVRVSSPLRDLKELSDDSDDKDLSDSDDKDISDCFRTSTDRTCTDDEVPSIVLPFYPFPLLFPVPSYLSLPSTCFLLTLRSV